MTAIRRFLADLIGAHINGVRVVCGLPLLFGAIIAWEFAQHVIEYRIGFYNSEAVAKAVSMDASRMVLGWVKMILVYVGGFFAIRYLVRGRAGGVMTPSWPTVGRYLPYIGYSLVLIASIFYAPLFLPPAQVTIMRTIVGLTQVALEPLLMLWIVSAATGGPVHGPVQSARETGWSYLWALPMFFIGRIPISAVHQLLGRYSIGKPAELLWPMLVLDALAVGLLVAIIPALYVRIAARIGERGATSARLSPIRRDRFR